MRVPEHPTLIRRMLAARRKQLAALGPLLAGTVTVIPKHCGRAACRCLNGGPKHTGNYLVCSLDGKTRTTYIPTDLLEDVRSWNDNYRRLKSLLQEMQQLTLALIRSHVQHRNSRQGRP